MSGRALKFGAGVSLFPLAVLFGIELLDQATQSAFNVLTPNIRDAFHLTNAGILLIVAIAGAAALVCTLPIAVLADRIRRVPIALVGALVGAGFSIALGLANGVVLAAVMLAGISMGQAVIFPTHNSLLADYYPVEARPRIYSAHRSGISLGAVIGVLLGAGLAAVWSWRAPFFFFAVPIVVVVLIGLRLREPPRGRHEQLQLEEQMLASERGEAAPLDDVAPDADLPVEPAPSLGEAWRTVWKIGVLRRIFFALPFLAASIAGFTSLASLQYQETFHLDAVHRAYLIAPIQIFDLLGLAVGAVIATRLANRDIGLVFRMLAVASVVAAGFAVLFALAPNEAVAFIGNAGIDASLAIVGPGVLAALSLGHPGAGALGRVLHRRPLRAARLPRPTRHRCHRGRRWLPLRAPHPRAHLHGRRVDRGHGRQPDRPRCPERVDLHADADADAEGPSRRQAPAPGRAGPRGGLRRRDRPSRRRHHHRRGRDRRPPRYQWSGQVDPAPGGRRCRRGRPRRHRLRRP